MSGTEQQYYEVLTRTDHPVFLKDYSTSQDINSPLNSIWNRLFAKQLVRIRAVLDEFQLNLVPDSVTAMTIDDWETQYFGYTKPALTLAQRKAELMIKLSKRFSMSTPDALVLSQAIVGKTPFIIRNLNLSGWVMGQAALGISTVFGGAGSTGIGEYLVYFTSPVNSDLINKLDQALTSIEKAGSTHKVKSPIQFWILGQTALGIDTTLGA